MSTLLNQYDALLNSLRYSPGINYSLPLTSELYPCTVPSIATMTDRQILTRGFPKTGNKRYDKHIATEPVRVMIPIKAMLGHYERGYTVIINDPMTLLTVYIHVYNYLRQQSDQFKSVLTINQSPVDINDLILMDEFNKKLYEYASQFYYTQIAGQINYLNQHIDLYSYRTSNQSRPTMGEYQSQADVFKEHEVSRSGFSSNQSFELKPR